MKLANFVRLHWAALRALLVLTVITGLGYPLFVWLVLCCRDCTTTPRVRSCAPTAHRSAAS